MPTPEDKVKKAVVAYLQKQGHFVLVHNTMGVFDAKLGAYRRSPYLWNGESDLMVCPKGRLEFIFVELKAKGRLSPDQVAFKHAVEDWGFEYAVVRSVEDCIGLGL